MQDRSHRWLFFGVTAMMALAALYGSEAGPLLLANDVSTAPEPAHSASLVVHNPAALAVAVSGGEIVTPEAPKEPAPAIVPASSENFRASP